MKQLRPMDSNFYYFDAPNQPMMIGSLWICDQSTAPGELVRHKQILQYIDDRLWTTSVFRRRLQRAPLELDEPYWLEDKNFDIEYHVRHVALPYPGDWRQLSIFVARTMSRAVDMDRAPWEICIIEGLNNVEGIPSNSFAVLIRFHHAYVDGKAGLALTTALWEDTPNHDYGVRKPVQYAEQPPSPYEMWLRTAPRMITKSFNRMRAGMDLGVKGTELLARLQRDDIFGQTRVPKTMFNTAVTPHRTFNCYDWPIKDLKRIRGLCDNATINDVLLSVLAGGIRRYLLSHDALPSKESLVAMCPVALRKEDTRYEGGNMVSAMYVPIGTNIEDPLERLETVHRRAMAQLPIAREVYYHLANSAVDMYPAYLRAMFAWFNNRFKLAARVPYLNTLITNLPGLPGTEPKYFAGAKILSVTPLAPIVDGMAVSHAISGIYENVNVGVMADREVMPDIDFYIGCIRESTREYLECADLMEKRSAPKSGSPKKSAPKANAGKGAKRAAGAPAKAESQQTDAK